MGVISSSWRADNNMGRAGEIQKKRRLYQPSADRIASLALVQVWDASQ